MYINICIYVRTFSHIIFKRGFESGRVRDEPSEAFFLECRHVHAPPLHQRQGPGVGQRRGRHRFPNIIYFCHSLRRLSNSAGFEFRV